MNMIKETLNEIGEAGKNEDGSYTRSCFSSAYFQAVDIVKKQMLNLGMQVSIDAAGNIHGVLYGSDPKAKSIIIGSHLDTVPSGGLFDGAYGVAAGIEVIRRMKDEKKQNKHTIEIYGFNAEESSPFGGTFGSRVVCGLVKEDQQGLQQALANEGKNIKEIMNCKRDFSNAKCYIEAHIEQGDRLYSDKIDIGVVSGIVSVIRYKVTAIGQSNHAGTTMMKNRKDAMVAMARLISEAEEECKKIDDTLVFTVGTIQLWPGSENVIPGKVECTFEIRHMDHKKVDIFVKKIREIASKIKTVEFEIVNKIDKESICCDTHLIDVINHAAEKAGVTHIVMPSGAGHDANPMAHCLPVGMIFVPSREGLSHCGEEWTEQRDLENGVNVLYHTILDLDQE